jgi:hypothetical protein
MRIFGLWFMVAQQFYMNVIHPEGPAFQALFDKKIRMASHTCPTRAGFNEWHSVTPP